MTYFEDTGTISWLLIEFPGGKEVNGDLVPPLLDLVDRHQIRILDALLFRKDADGNVETLTTNELDAQNDGALGELAGASSGLIDDDDAKSAADTLEPSSAGVLIVYEELWSLPFARAARQAGGQLVASGHIPVQAILARLDALEA